MTATIGISHSEASLDVLGTFQVETRTNFGDEFPVIVEEYRKYVLCPGCFGQKTLINGHKIAGRKRDMFPGESHERLGCPFSLVCFDRNCWRRNLTGLDV